MNRIHGMGSIMGVLMMAGEGAAGAKAVLEGTKATTNRFDGIFGDVKFINDPAAKIYEWRDGKTKQPTGEGSTQTIATAVIALGKSGLYITARMVVTRQPGKDPVLKLAMPSGGSQFKKEPILSANGDGKVAADLAAWENALVAKFTIWRKANLPNHRGNVATVGSGMKADLNELGLDA